MRDVVGLGCDGSVRLPGYRISQVGCVGCEAAAHRRAQRDRTEAADGDINIISSHNYGHIFGQTIISNVA